MISDIFAGAECILKKIHYKIFKKHIRFGKKSRFKKGCIFYADRQSKLIIGNNVFFNRNCSVVSRGEIIIGDNCLFGENIKIYDHNHIFNVKGKNVNECGLNIKSIKIGKNCWFGSNSVITAGTTIGDNCVIGAGVVVSGSIESDTLIKYDQKSFSIKKIEYK